MNRICAQLLLLQLRQRRDSHRAASFLKNRYGFAVFIVEGVEVAATTGVSPWDLGD
jgi:hypothetical protein